MIRVLLDDLARLPADALLRPADGGLQPATAGARRVDAVAGPEFALLCRVRDPLQRGAAVVTGGGALATPFVLHCVVQDAEGHADRGMIRRTLVAAWQQAEAWELTHVAAPLLGVGAGGVTVDEAARLLAETWREARGPAGRSLTIVTESDAERELVTAAVRAAGVAA